MTNVGREAQFAPAHAQLLVGSYFDETVFQREKSRVLTMRAPKTVMSGTGTLMKPGAILCALFIAGHIVSKGSYLGHLSSLKHLA